MRVFLLFILLFFSFTAISENPVFAATSKKKRAYRKKSTRRPSSKRVRKPKRRKKINPDITLSRNTIFMHARRAATRKPRTRIPQIDILNSLFFLYKDDPRLIRGNMRIIITGYHFSRGYSRARHLFGESGDKGIFQSREKPPDIKYMNFQSITLFSQKKRCRMAVSLREGYTQELPYTFGAKITMRKSFSGTVRANPSGLATDVVFDSDRSVRFKPPGIAFFVPEMRVKIACIAHHQGEIYGYVIGRPVKSPKKYVAVRYNLTTCAKGSIKTYKLSRRDYMRKIADPSYFGFL